MLPVTHGLEYIRTQVLRLTVSLLPFATRMTGP
ncbi:hypothetical protein SADO_14534 [Salinisphaera dokdonensis CL-ES53]|uniref:Uncharacterized protein n=1 Tax=Salinisphaera dokdonensis CL-ES53 TaxID=1304272 RepID=A0ABV2B3L2_9GAMM